MGSAGSAGRLRAALAALKATKAAESSLEVRGGSAALPTPPLVDFGERGSERARNEVLDFPARLLPELPGDFALELLHAEAGTYFALARAARSKLRALGHVSLTGAEWLAMCTAVDNDRAWGQVGVWIAQHRTTAHSELTVDIAIGGLVDVQCVSQSRSTRSLVRLLDSQILNVWSFE